MVRVALLSVTLLGAIGTASQALGRAPVEYRRGGPSTQAPAPMTTIVASLPLSRQGARPQASAPIDLRGVLAPAPRFDPIPINAPLEDGRAEWAEAPEAAAPAFASPRGGDWVVQIGVFANRDNVESARLALADVGHLILEPRRIGAREAMRVRLGPWESRLEAEQALARVGERGYADAIVAMAR